MYSLTKKSIIPPHNINTMDIPMEEKDFIKAYAKDFRDFLKETTREILQ